MDILKPLSEEQEAAAAQLDTRQLSYANLWLTIDQHGMTAGECYWLSGYETASDDIAAIGASRLRRIPRVDNYIRVMRGESLRTVGLTLEYLDAQLAEIIDGNAVDTEGVADLRDLPDDVQRTIHSIENTKYGRKIRTYSRLDAMRLAYQRHGALTDRKELTGANGGPLEVKELSDAELDARIRRLAGDAAD